MKRTPIAAITLATAALVLTGCGGVEKDATYDNPESLAKAVNAVSDLDCQEGDYALSIEKYGWVNIPCAHTAAAVFESASIQDDVVEKSLDEAGKRALVGRNWAVFGPQFEIEDLQRDLGGTVEAPTGE